MRLVRFVFDPGEWQKALKRRDEGSRELPVIALRAFTPEPRDNGRISLFRLDQDAAAASLAAAWWLIQSRPFTMIAVDEALFLAEGFELADDAGQTYHKAINPLHRDLLIRSGETVIRASQHFYELGRLVQVDQKEIRASIANDNGVDLIDFPKLAAGKNTQSHGQLRELIAKKTLVLRAP